MRTRFTAVTLCGIALLGAAIGCRRGGGDAAVEAPIRLTYSVFFPPTHVHARLAVEWSEEIARRTEGRVQIQVFPGGALTRPEQCWQGVVTGVSDIGMSCFAYTRGRFPLLEALDLPMGYPDGQTATAIANAVITEHRSVHAELADAVVLYLHAHGPAVLASKRPVRSAADLAGLKVRATGLSSKVVESLGATPVAMSQPETYDALQRGVVDATLCPIETLKGWNQGEVISHITEADALGYTTTMFVAFNREAWARLPEEVRVVFRDVSAEWIERHGEAWNMADEEGRAFVAELGRETIVLDDAEQARWSAAVATVIDDYVRRTHEAGLPGEALVAEIRAAVAAARASLP